MMKVSFYCLFSTFLLIPALYGQSGNIKQPGASRPNVLFIVADDLNCYSLLKNYPVLKTPAIDKLASESYYFPNATCAAPVCIPSRASFFTGRYPHNTGSYFNASDTWNNTTLSTTEVMPETFKKSGYTTWGRGKIFHVEINEGREGKMFDNKVFKGGFGPFGEKEDRYGKSRWTTIKPWEGPDTDFPDVKNADAAVDFLSQKHDKPFFMYYGLFRPHSPYTAPKRFYDLYKDVVFTPPPGYEKGDLDDVPALGRDLVDSMAGSKRAGLSKKEVWMDLMKAYCANTSFADWNIGKVLEALDKSPYAANTIVIFCSDNGFHNGTKEHWAKSTLWDQADVVPFLVRMPGGKAYKCPQTVSLIDIYPTLVEYCGLTVPAHSFDGKSMVPLFNNPKAAWNRPGITSFGEQYTGVRDERYRYIRYPDGTEELYDHKTDPYEHINIAGKASMKEVKSKLMQAVPQQYAKSLGRKGGEEVDEGSGKNNAPKVKKKGGFKAAK